MILPQNVYSSDGAAAPAAAIHEGRSRRLIIRVLFWVFFGARKKYENLVK